MHIRELFGWNIAWKPFSVSLLCVREEDRGQVAVSKEALQQRSHLEHRLCSSHTMSSFDFWFGGSAECVRPHTYTHLKREDYLPRFQVGSVALYLVTL